MTLSLWVYSTPSEPGADTQFERDQEIAKAVKRVSYGSGYNLVTGERDVSFNFSERNGPQLARAITAVLRLPHVQRVQVLRKGTEVS